MSASEKLSLLISLDANGAIKGFEGIGKTADKELNKAKERSDKLAASMTKFGAAGLAASGVLAVGLFKAASAFDEANFATLQLENSLNNMPKLAGENKKAFTDLSTAIQRKTAADGDQITAAQAMLGTFNLTGDQIRSITPLVVDYARKFGTDLVNASIQVGKALDGNVGALKKNGVSIDETLYKTDSYRAVQEALANQVGGFAEAEGKTFSGSLQRLQNQLGDIVENVGAGVIPVFEKLSAPIGRFAEKIAQSDPAVQGLVGSIAAIATVGTGTVSAMSFIAGQTIKLRERFKVADGAVGVFGTSLSKMGAATLGIGTALAVAGGAIAYFAEQNAAAKKKIQDTTDTLRKLGDVAGSDEIVGGLLKQKNQLDDLVSAGLDVKGLSAALKEYGESVTKAGSQTRLKDIASTPAGYWEKEIAGLRGSSNELDKYVIALYDAGQLNEGLVNSIFELGDQLDKGRSQQQAYDKGLQGTAEQLQLNAEKEKEDEDAIKKRYQTIESKFATETVYQRSLLKTTEKLDEVAAALKGSGKSSVEYADAVLDARDAVAAQAQAAVDFKVAQAEANGEVINAATQQELYKQELDSVLAGIQPGSPLRDALVSYSQDLRSLPEKVRTEVVVAIDDAEYQRLYKQLRTSTFGSPNVQGPIPGEQNLKVKGRAAGGNLSPFTTYEVNEKGTELLTMGSKSGYITPANRLPGASSSGQPVSQTTVVHMTVSGADPQEVINAIKRFEKRNGTGWKAA
jgi:hypothetical protein